MFAHAPAPHLARPPATARRGPVGRDKENAGVHLPAKTPMRAPLGGGGAPFKPGTAGPSRILGGKTVERNVLAPKGSGSAPIEEIEPKRLFQVTKTPAPAPQPQRAHRTPAPQRQNTLRTPAPARGEPIGPSPVPLPSAQRTRRRSRSRLSLASAGPGTPDMSFHKNHQWDQEVSLDSILEADVEGAQLAEILEYYGEDEYAMPTAKDMPYVPEWAESIPDPVASMKALGTMRPMFYAPLPSPPPELEDVEFMHVALVDDGELEDDLFRKPRAAAKPPVRPLGARAPVPSIRTTRPASAAPRSGVAAPTSMRTTRPASVATTATTSRPLVSRPASTASSRPATISRPPSGITTTRPLAIAPRTGRPGATSSLRPLATAGSARLAPPAASRTPSNPSSPASDAFVFDSAAFDLDLDLDFDALTPDLTPDPSPKRADSATLPMFRQQGPADTPTIDDMLAELAVANFMAAGGVSNFEAEGLAPLSNTPGAQNHFDHVRNVYGVAALEAAHIAANKRDERS
ncbi:hypothetical protein Q8F55_004148 [Vanrija albida]|uniref:Uncharacterized protein n=1 Tax=Vanrija albida TaxID=181172 RepID=A0ABR3Q5Y2_9TREE